MALEAATNLISQICFAALWKHLRIAFGCLQAVDEQEEQERQNEQANVDGVGRHKVCVENVISCCGGGTINVKEGEAYSRQRVTEALFSVVKHYRKKGSSLSKACRETWNRFSQKASSRKADAGKAMSERLYDKYAAVRDYVNKGKLPKTKGDISDNRRFSQPRRAR